MGNAICSFVNNNQKRRRQRRLSRRNHNEIAACFRPCRRLCDEERPVQIYNGTRRNEDGLVMMELPESALNTSVDDFVTMCREQPNPSYYDFIDFLDPTTSPHRRIYWITDSVYLFVGPIHDYLRDDLYMPLPGGISPFQFKVDFNTTIIDGMIYSEHLRIVVVVKQNRYYHDGEEERTTAMPFSSPADKVAELLLYLLSLRTDVSKVDIYNDTSNRDSHPLPIFPVSGQALEDFLSRASSKLERVVLDGFSLDSSHCHALGNFNNNNIINSSSSSSSSRRDHRDIGIRLQLCMLQDPTAFAEGIRLGNGPARLSCYSCFGDEMMDWGGNKQSIFDIILSVVGRSSLRSLKIGNWEKRTGDRRGYCCVDEEKHTLFAALSQNKSLTKLHVDSLRVDERELATLCGLVFSHPSLQEVQIYPKSRDPDHSSTNFIAEVIEPGFRANTRIKYLAISDLVPGHISHPFERRNRLIQLIEGISHEPTRSRKLYLSAALTRSREPKGPSEIYLWITLNVDVLLY